MKGRRKERLAALIQREIASLILKGVKDPRMQEATITQVHVTDDLAVARVFFTAHRDSDIKKIYKGFQSAKGYLRGQIADYLKSRHAPELEFVYDDSFDLFEKIRQAGPKAGDDEPGTP